MCLSTKKQANYMSVKVLIVEDNEDYRELVDFYLKLKGFEVILAADGLEGVELTSTGKPHIILMDLNLPLRDGWEATKIIKQNFATSHIPIIAVSANYAGNKSDKILGFGAVGCVQKRIDIETLPDLILSYALTDESSEVSS
jgi:CheY-like chemotaxis protein